MTGPTIRKRKISDYTPDARNANKGSERGQYMIDTSVESVGLARSIVAANDDTIPAGNKTLQAAMDAGIEDVIEVETDGNALVVVKRTDWATVDSEAARQYAYLDNRASEVGLQWDAEQVLRDLDSGADLSGMFRDWELDKVLGKLQDGEFDPMAEWEGMPEFEQDDLTPTYSIKVNFKTLDDLKAFGELVEQALTEKTKSLWFPYREDRPHAGRIFVDER
jgi:hypothetical protein